MPRYPARFPRYTPPADAEHSEAMAKELAERMAEPQEATPVYGTPLPSDAERVEEVIDRAVKRMLTLTMDPKDLAKAVEAATKWVGVKNKISEDEGWGSKLGGGTTTP